MDFLIQTAYAQELNQQSSFDVLLSKITTNIISPIIYFLMALAVVYFFWGVLVFIGNADKSDKRIEGYNHMIWGIIGIFIMISVRGLIHIILTTLGL
jgi:uncharacterized membrane protein